MVSVKTFEFNNQPAGITAFTRLVLNELSAMLLQYHHEGDVLFKVKIIVAELLNNAVKHSGVPQTQLQLHLDDGELLIVKTDSGKPLRFLHNLNKQEQHVVITTDAMHTLYAVSEGEKALRFYCEENLAEKIDPVLLAEHMGLLIITKAAHWFTYRYQQPNNIFKVKINLG